ncbi:MAG TPA: alpha/beta fold hydrolase [Deltaproteobacteria bacterium]|nr:alpha/beta fold hydrolase [Deltaproteobacteria bacterium]HPJ93268.1 alpha/beta fold hydrolase [Deltaproteobacteria bacterium]
MKSKEFQLTREGIKIRVWLYCPDDNFRGLRPVVILCHGIPGSKPDPSDSGYMSLVEDIVSEKYCCAVFNFRGCGESGGNIDMKGWFDDLSAVVYRIYNTPGIDPKSIHCIGFSAGGAIAAKVASFEKNLQSLLLMASPQNFSDILPDDPWLLREHFRQIGLIRDDDFPQDINRWYEDFLDLTPEQYLPFISPRKLGIVHGDQDETVPPEHAQRLFDSACHPKKITMLKGAVHQLRKDPRTRQIIRDWLKEVR